MAPNLAADSELDHKNNNNNNKQINWVSSEVRTSVHQRTFYQDDAKTAHGMGETI